MRNLLLASVASMGALLAATSGAMAQPVKPVAAGTVVVHLNGYLQFGINDMGSTYNTYSGNKLSSVATNGDVRLYAGFDAQTVSGVDYGTQIELRTTTSDAGVGAGKTTGTGSTQGTSSIYVKRAYGYLGTPDVGFIRFGQTDGAFGLTQTGVIEAFGDGSQWPGDGSQVIVLPSGATPGNFIYADTSSLYATNKILYITPAYVEPLLGGSLSATVGYEPNSNGIKEGYGSYSTAGSTAADLASSTSASDLGKRRQNTFDAGMLYTLKANGFATKADIGFIHGTPIRYNGTTPLTAAQKFDDLEVLQIGAQTTFAGLTVGANVKAGQVKDGYAFKVKGTRDALAYTIGASYVLGPYVVGASFFDSQSAGGYTPGGKVRGRSLSEYGTAVGANYVIGKDLSLYVQYMYGHAHQVAGYLSNNGTSNARNSVQVQAIGTGATFKW
jgi:hypothetical protein